MAPKRTHQFLPRLHQQRYPTLQSGILNSNALGLFSSHICSVFWWLWTSRLRAQKARGGNIKPSAAERGSNPRDVPCLLKLLGRRPLPACVCQKIPSFRVWSRRACGSERMAGLSDYHFKASISNVWQSLPWFSGNLDPSPTRALNIYVTNYNQLKTSSRGCQKATFEEQYAGYYRHPTNIPEP